MDNNSGIPSDLMAWRQVVSLFEDGILRDKLKGLSQDTLNFVANEENQTKLVDSMVEELRVIDPEKANVEYAAKVVGMMSKIAKYLLVEN